MPHDVMTISEGVMSGRSLDLEEAFFLAKAADLCDLIEGGRCIRERFCGNRISLCSIMNAKSGRCPEDCRFCAQSGHYRTGIQEYPLVDAEGALKAAGAAEAHGVHRFGLVTSGRKLNDREFDRMLEIVRALRRETRIQLCASLGTLSMGRAEMLRDAGITRYHHNVETCAEYFPNICSTHTYQDRIETLRNVTAAGLDPCSGGIIGMGESMEHRIRMAFEIRALGVKSIPLNILNPIPGTPMGSAQRLDTEEILRTIAVFRFVIPDGELRYAGGRSALGDRQGLGLTAGISAVMVGNFLTTAGNDINSDLAMIRSMGMEA